METFTDFADVWGSVEALRMAVAAGYVKPGREEHARLTLADEIDRLQLTLKQSGDDCETMRALVISGAQEANRLRKDAELLAWVIAHPETAAEVLQDAAAGDGIPRENLEVRRAGLASA